MGETFLYQNASRSITVLDLPHSIEHGQGSLACLKSAAAPEVPYRSTEPRRQKREKLLDDIPKVERDYHNGICDVLEPALREARRSIGDRGWCYARNEQPTPDEIPHLIFDDGEGRPWVAQPPLLLSSAFENRVPDLAALQRSLVTNSSRSGTTIAAEAHSFFIPAQSAFLCTSIARGLPLLNQALASTLFSTGSGGCKGYFDFILLDPPWANRSVRHAKVYRTAETQTSPFDQVLPILQYQVAPSGIIAVWVTNKAAIRTHVLQALSNIGLELNEEWILLKVTSKGEPVTAMDGLWRKPYEILLLFTRCQPPTSSPQRRIVITVPDLHSRKPCLKQLIEPFLPQQYHALELFARNLTAGWWSLGDECLKYQHTSQWEL